MPSLNMDDLMPEIKRSLECFQSDIHSLGWVVSDIRSSSHCMVPQPANIFRLAIPDPKRRPVKIDFAFSLNNPMRIPDISFVNDDLKELHNLFMNSGISDFWKPKSDPRSLLELTKEILKITWKHVDESEWRKNNALFSAFKEMLAAINPPGADPTSEEMVEIEVRPKKVIFKVAFNELKGSVEVRIRDPSTFPIAKYPPKFTFFVQPWLEEMMDPDSHSRLLDAEQLVNESETTLAGALSLLRDVLKAEFDSFREGGLARKAFVERVAEKVNGVVTYDQENFRSVQIVFPGGGTYALFLTETFPEEQNSLMGYEKGHVDPLPGFSFDPSHRSSNPKDLADFVVDYFANH